MSTINVVRNLNYSVISFPRFVKQVNADSTWQKKRKTLQKRTAKLIIKTKTTSISKRKTS